MARAPLQILVLPYHRLPGGGHRYALFRRNRQTGGYWQAIAGGAEDEESPLEAARREALEEAGIPPELAFFELDARTTVSVNHFGGGGLWPDDIYVVPVHVFAVDIADRDIRISKEHVAYGWFTYEAAAAKVHWDIDRTALFELNRRLQLGRI